MHSASYRDPMATASALVCSHFLLCYRARLRPVRPMRERDLKHFQGLLNEKLEELLAEADRTVDVMTDSQGRELPRPDRSRLAGIEPQLHAPHPRPRAQADRQDQGSAGPHRRRHLRQMRGVRREHQPRAPGGPTGHHPLHRLQVPPGGARAEAPRRALSVRKAVIPAAGLGTRFLPATKAIPKEMLPIVDIPTIQYVVEEAVASGIDHVILVTGRGKDSIDRPLRPSPPSSRPSSPRRARTSWWRWCARSRRRSR